MQTTVKKLPNSEVEIDVTIPETDLLEHKKNSLKTLGETLSIDGFRKGAAPDDIIEKHAGTMALYTEMAYAALGIALQKTITDEKLHAIGTPRIVIKKLAPGNALEATITIAIMPTVTLPDYKKIAKELNKAKEAVVVADEELESAIKELRQMRAHDKMHEDGVEHHSHNHREIKDEDLPPVDEEFVKKVGGFGSVEEFRTKLKENLQSEKERREQEKTRITLIDAIIEKSEIELPNLLIDLEIDRIMERMAHDISMMGMSFDDYIKRINKSRDDLRAEWRDQATMNAKTSLIIEEIGNKEKLDPKPEEVADEVAKVTELYKDKGDIDPKRVESYVTTMLKNQKVIEFLEAQ